MTPEILKGLNKIAGNIVNRSFFGQALPDQMRKAINKAKKVVVSLPKNDVNRKAKR